MSRVLISFLGTGPRKDDSKEQGHSLRKYKEAKYRLDNEIYESSFVSAALCEHYDIDRVIMIGTPHSMWEEVYRWFAEYKDLSLDEDKYFEIAEYCDAANSSSELNVPYKEIIENALGANSKIVLIKYGLTKEEQDENIKNILEIEKVLNTGDEIILDISHSFRSLPLMIMNLFMYLQEVSRKHVTISHIHYGMFEAKDSDGVAPIVEMNQVLKINQTISGAYSFKEYGNAYRLADIVNEYDPSLAAKLRSFSNILNYNHLSAMRNEVKNLSTVSTFGSDMSSKIIGQVIKEFISKLKGAKSNSEFQYRLAVWQYEHKNYSSSLTSLVEAVVTYVCEKNGGNWLSKDDRDLAKTKVEDFLVFRELKHYRKLNKMRNSIVHISESYYTTSDMTMAINEGIDYIGRLICS